jgi:hypothetical protein
VLTVPGELDGLGELDPLVAAEALLDDEPPAGVLELLLELELHPARTPPTARTEARAAASRHLRWVVVCIDSLPSRGYHKKRLRKRTGRASRG